jgi:hypothetical protein
VKVLAYSFSAGVPVITRPKGTRQRRIARNVESEILRCAQNDRTYAVGVFAFGTALLDVCWYAIFRAERGKPHAYNRNIPCCRRLNVFQTQGTAYVLSE